MGEFTIVCRWSDEETSGFMEDFFFVLEQVWGSGFDRNSARSRYLDNIFGASLIVITYLDGSPCGTQAFWRNDIGKRIAYQADDGAVLKEARGRGLLQEMLKRGVKILGEDVLLYSYTNNKSKPSFMKLGWDVISSQPLKPLITAKSFLERCPFRVDFDYAKWFLHKRKNISYVKRSGHYFLVIPTSRRYVDYAISSCDERTAKLFERRKNCLMLVYAGQSNVLDDQKKGNIVVKGHRGEYIPVWKCDAV